jgi:hypothetical protein
VLNPDPNAKTKVTEIREITLNGEMVGRPEVRVERGDGTFASSVPLKLPTSAKKGVYLVRSTIQSESAQDSRDISFTVK